MWSWQQSHGFGDILKAKILYGMAIHLPGPRPCSSSVSLLFMVLSLWNCPWAGDAFSWDMVLSSSSWALQCSEHRNRTMINDTHSWFCNHSWPLRPVTLPQSLHREKISSLETPHLYAWSQPTCSASTSLPPCIINEQYQSPVFSQLICSHSHDSKYHTSNSSSYFNGS